MSAGDIIMTGAAWHCRAWYFSGAVSTHRSSIFSPPPGTGKYPMNCPVLARILARIIADETVQMSGLRESPLFREPRLRQMRPPARLSAASRHALRHGACGRWRLDGAG